MTRRQRITLALHRRRIPYGLPKHTARTLLDQTFHDVYASMGLRVVRK